MTDQLYGLNHVIGGETSEERRKQDQATQERRKEAIDALRQSPSSPERPCRHTEPTVREPSSLERMAQRISQDLYGSKREMTPEEKADYYKRESERKTVEMAVLWQVIDRLHERLRSAGRDDD